MGIGENICSTNHRNRRKTDPNKIMNHSNALLLVQIKENQSMVEYTLCFGVTNCFDYTEELVQRTVNEKP